MLSFYLIETRFSITKEIAVHFTVNKEKSLYESNTEKFFYLINSRIFIPESSAFSKFGNFSKIKGFDVEEYIDESEENEEKYNKLYYLLRNIYLYELIHENLDRDNGFLVSKDEKENMLSDMVIDIYFHLIDKLPESVLDMIPNYYYRFFKEMQEEYKTVEEWSSFYNIELSKSKEFKSKTNKHQVNYTRIKILEVLTEVDDIEISDELDYDLKTYFTEPV